MTADEIKKARGQIVAKHNRLIQKNRYNLSELEQKIVLYLTSKIKPTDDVLTWYDFSIKEFCQVCGIDDDSGGNYAYVKKVIENLHSKHFWVEFDDGSESLCSWVNKARLYKNSGTIKIRLDDDLHGYLLQLGANYTHYELITILPMRSQYSIRLYELFKSYSWLHKDIVVAIEDLKKRLGCTIYTRYPDFRRKVIEPAIAEINKYAELGVEWKALKSGKAYSHLKYTIKSKSVRERLLATQRILEEIGGTPMGIEGQMTIYDLADDEDVNIIKPLASTEERPAKQTPKPIYRKEKEEETTKGAENERL